MGVKLWSRKGYHDREHSVEDPSIPKGDGACDAWVSLWNKTLKQNNWEEWLTR